MLEQQKPEALGFDEARLQRVSEAIQGDIDSGSYDGAAIAVGRRGALAMLSVYGYAHRASDRRLVNDDVFLTFSSGKQFTATVVLNFIERGLLQLHRPVAEVIPEFAKKGKGKITLAHLLTHTSGIPSMPPVAAPADMFNLEKTVAAVCDAGPETLPGSCVRYCIASAHAVMAEMVRRVDGGNRSFGEIVGDELFAPLGMADTAFGLPDRLRERFCPVVVTDRSPGLLPPDMLEGWNSALNADFEFPAGGYVTTIGDFARFVEMLRGGGALDGERILSPAMLQLARQNFTGQMPNDIWNYAVELRNWPVFPAFLGLGFYLRGYGTHPAPFGSLASFDSFGGIGAGSTYFFVDPPRDLSVCFLSTGLLEESRSTERHQRISDLVLGSLVEL